MRLRRARWDKVPWCSVSIELKAVTRQDRCFVGIALIDRRQVGWLVNGEPRSFRLEPGEHVITIYIARAANITIRSMVLISRRIVLQSRENVSLVCGRTPRAMASWNARRSAAKGQGLALYCGSIFFGGLAWLVYPSLREAIADASLRLQLGEPWLSLLYLPVRWRPGTAMLGYFGWMLFFVVVSLVQEYRLRRRPDCRSIEPYFLVKAETLEIRQTLTPVLDNCLVSLPPDCESVFSD
jgi:hypothetical protein